MSRNETYLPVDKMEVFHLFEGVSDWVWAQVVSWPHLAQDTIGKQLVRSSDSVNANLVEGDGRYTDPDALKFFVIARGSARETRLWVRRAIRRNLVSEADGERQIAALESGAKLLNNLIRYRRQSNNKNMVRESIANGWTFEENRDPFCEVAS